MGKIFKVEPTNTCKHEWQFEIDDNRVIRKVTILGNKGCIGNPQITAILLVGRKLDEVNTEALGKVECAQEVSCGMKLAGFVEELKKG